MNQIRIADFCEKYGHTKDQIRHASRTGKLQRIAKGILDEQLALQIMSYTKPLKNPKQPLHPTIEQSIQTPKKPKFLSQAWVNSMVAPASNGGKFFPSDE